ncbi:AraC family transcriptional regulator [Ancylobacter sp. A5.8]|uniref:helix-turn-helix domain-containing protein n=1 Tax=Ancylobacter gelatini TaxID=2919920 RepID=UPI001F4DCC2C|nr:AraC family transcriptional regulator [Ancylobacter gelatini]MCJ8142840.1 AraC family transcriptional regulator [Ancylobacter gelatini]
MSLHVTPPSAGFTSAANATLPPSDAARNALSMRLDHMGVVLAIGPAATARRQATEDDVPVIHLQVGASSLDRSPLFDDAAASSRGKADPDPVIDRLSRALDAAESSDREFGGLYADALRLAIVTRVLSGHDAQARRLEEPETVTAPRRPKSGLPKWRLKRVVSYIDENLSESVTLAGMAAAAGLSRMHFAAQFRVATGLRPHEFLLRRRVERAQAMMTETRDSLVEIALAVGFQTQAHFTTVFRRFVGDTPYQWRSANRAHH